ncbi:MAG: hypothetical protein PHZ04_03205 [Patescibacteria group bacterium]|nr:hypothetical protein [Patescibacteria group bacterium]MDD5294656.1 hypothetical protein [Patescibacteria group bacterium]MDD5554707.1 hypothetical protein [Patescibacteria group bacterium]
MKKTEMIDQGNGKKSWKLIFALVLLGIGLASLTIIGLIKFGTVLFFVPFWFWTVDKIIELTGANIWLARGFAALFVMPFFYLIKLMFSWKVWKRRAGWILFSLLTASLCFTMFFLSEDIYFSFKTGQAQKWYIVTPTGEYQFSTSPGYSTFWGIQYQPVTPDVIKKYKEAFPGKAIFTMDKGFLTPEEQNFLVEEAKGILVSFPSHKEGSKLSDILRVLYESECLPKHEDLLCDIIMNILSHDSSEGWFNGPDDAVRYLAKVGSTKSIPTLLWVIANENNYSARQEATEAVKAIKARGM